MMAAAREPETPVYSSAPGIPLAMVKELLRRAVLTLAAVPDPDLRYRLGLSKSAWPDFVREARDAYGSAPPKFRMFQPTRRDLSVFSDVLGMLAWYQRDRSRETVRLFTAWAFGAAVWQLQERCSTNRRRPASPSTVHNRLNGMVIAIVEEFPEAIFKLMLDELTELGEKAPSDSESGGLSTDARDLPRSRPTWSAPPEAQQTRAEEAAATKALTKTLEKHKSRALGRKQKRARS